MDWWQVVLIVLTSIVVGLLVGGLLSYLIVRVPKKLFVKKRKATAVVEEQLKSTAPEPAAEVEGNRIVQLLKKPFVKKREAPAVVEEQLKSTVPVVEEQLKSTVPVVEEQLKSTVPEPAAEVEGNRIVQLLKKPFLKKREATAVVEEQLKPTAPALVAEVENNRRTATEPWSGKLLRFQSGVWDTSGDKVHTLPANVREDLTQAYADMRLANSIVWLSTELGRRSPNLDENYMRLCTSIAARLNKITPLLRQSGN